MAALTIELNDHIAIMADVEMKPFRNHWTGSILLDLTHFEIYSFVFENLNPIFSALVEGICCF